MPTKQNLIQQEIDLLEGWIELFDPNYPFDIELSPSKNSVIITGFPMPDGIKPDRLEICLLLDYYPAESPIGIYIRQTEANKHIIKQIKSYLNVFRDQGYHDAPSIKGYDWVCLHYNQNSRWQLNPNRLSKGDCLYKFLEYFHIVCGRAC